MRFSSEALEKIAYRNRKGDSKEPLALLIVDQKPAQSLLKKLPLFLLGSATRQAS